MVDCPARISDGDAVGAADAISIESTVTRVTVVYAVVPRLSVSFTQ